jgi:hypothetical protein
VATTSSKGTYSASSVNLLLAALVIAILVALAGWVMALRSRRRPPDSGPVTPYPGPAAIGSAAPATSPTIPPAGPAAPSWSEDSPPR